MALDRSAFDETMANLFSNPKYNHNYLFYAHMISQCSVVLDTTFPAMAGVMYEVDHYKLFINPEDKWAPISQITNPDFDISKVTPEDIKTIDGEQHIRYVHGFNSRPLEKRMGVLKHEMLHILNAHVIRKGDRNHEKFNFATDCAINQHIEQSHLPSGAIFPTSDIFKSTPAPKLQIAETYYDLIDDSKIPQQPEEGDGDGEGNGQTQPGNGQGGGHGRWKDSKGNESLAKNITKKMIERSIKETQKGRGNLPSNISEYLTLFSNKSQLDWKKLLRRITGNKKVNSRRTILRRDRRSPQFEHIKGKTKDRMFDLLIVGDESGSVSSQELVEAVGESLNICRATKTPVWYIPIDTAPGKPRLLKSNIKQFERTACGGTILAPAVDRAKEDNILFKAVVVITDGGISESDVQTYKDLNLPIIWLITSEGYILDSMNSGKMKAFKLKSSKA